jgi:hypothetical protein
LYISTNGYINFGTSLGGIAASGNYFISALNYDLITSTSGSIYYQNLNSQSSDFNSIKSDLNRFDASFVPTNLFRITYDNVPIYSFSSNRVSFQIILASDSSKSYVLFKYTTCVASSFALRTLPGLYFLLANGQQTFIPISNSSCSNSNVNQAGTWVFNVTSPIGKIHYLIFIVKAVPVDYKPLFLIFLICSVLFYDAFGVDYRHKISQLKFRFFLD